MQILPLCRTLTSPPSLESLETALSQSPESPGTISWRVSSSRHPLRHTQGVFRVLGLRTSRLPRQVSTCSRASAVPSPRCLPANKPAPRPPVRIGTVSAAAPFASSFRSSQRKRLHRQPRQLRHGREVRRGSREGVRPPHRHPGRLAELRLQLDRLEVNTPACERTFLAGLRLHTDAAVCADCSTRSTARR